MMPPESLRDCGVGYVHNCQKELIVMLFAFMERTRLYSVVHI